MANASFIINTNTNRLHKSDTGLTPECGSVSENMTLINADNPLHAVVEFGAIPCARCISHSNVLTAVYKDRHTATVVHHDTDRLPWSLPEDTNDE